MFVKLTTCYFVLKHQFFSFFFWLYFKNHPIFLIFFFAASSVINQLFTAFFIFSFSFMFNVSVFADELPPEYYSSPGLLDDFVDKCLVDFWSTMNIPYPCSPNRSLEEHFDSINCLALSELAGVNNSFDTFFRFFNTASQSSFVGSYTLTSTDAGPIICLPPVKENLSILRTYRFGFEEVTIYSNKSPTFFSLATNFTPGRPTAVLIDFSDYMLGRPRSVKEVLELIGFALSAFCGGKALESYCHEKGYFR